MATSEKQLASAAKWREANREFYNQLMREYRQRNKELVSKRVRDNQLANPAKHKARQKLRHAIEMGRVLRGVCETCGATQVHGHHDDYSKPFNVRWLCSLHHMRLHKLITNR